MYIMNRWAVGVVLLAGSAVSLSITAPIVQAEPKKECEIISEWLEAHRDRLPSTILEISEYPIPYRRAIVTALPVDVQKQLWQEHLESFLENDLTINAAQQAVVLSALNNLDAYFDPATLAAADTDLRRQLDGVFTLAEAAAIFSMLGPSPTITTDGAVGRSMADCQCSRRSNYCWNSYCVTGSCTEVGGCGTFFQHPCDGVCGGGGPEH